MSEKQIICRIYLRIFLLWLVPGIALTAVGFVASLFRTGRVAEYTRLFSLLAFLVFLAAAVLRTFLIFVVASYRSKKWQGHAPPK